MNPIPASGDSILSKPGQETTPTCNLMQKECKEAIQAEVIKVVLVVIQEEEASAALEVVIQEEEASAAALAEGAESNSVSNRRTGDKDRILEITALVGISFETTKSVMLGELIKRKSEEIEKTFLRITENPLQQLQQLQLQFQLAQGARLAPAHPLLFN
jgi:hypothetical protein